MGPKLSRTSSNINIANCALTLEDLVKIETELHEKGIISEKGVSHLINHIVKNINVSITVCTTLESFDKFDMTTMQNNMVVIAKELNTSYVYSVLYKNKNGQMFYKNSEGVGPSHTLSSKLVENLVLIVNTSNDGPSGVDMQHWMALRNAFTIASIANQSEDLNKYVISQGFCQGSKVEKYSGKVLKQIHKKMCAKINIHEIRNILHSQSVDNAEGALDNVNVKAFVTVWNYAQHKIKKKLNIGKGNVRRFMDIYTSGQNQSEDINVDIGYVINLLKKESLYLSTVDDSDEHIKQWVRENRGELKRDEWMKIVAYCVIVMERKLKLKIRDNQLMAVVSFFMSDKHTFLEVKSGEGKMLIIALVAAVQVLLGHKVDIITSNDLLSVANAKQMNSFYEALGITCGCNSDNTNGKINPYKCDIVYGSIYQWQCDYLNNCLEVADEASHQRKYECCILDEVDLLARPQSQHMFNIAKPFPGMESLIDVFLSIYHNENVSLAKYPAYLRPYCEYMIPIWTASRTNVDVSCEENIQFLKDCNKIIPIDVENTGALMLNSVFSDGTQQFLEFAHHGRESISTVILQPVSISNHGFVRLYQHQRVFGISAMLPSQKEQDIMKQEVFYQQCVQFIRIPSAFGESKFKEYKTAYVLEDGDEEIIQLSKQIATTKGTNVFLGNQRDRKRRFAKACTISSQHFSWKLSEEVMECINQDKFSIIGDCPDELLPYINSNCAGMIVWDDKKLLCQAKLVNKLVEQFGLPRRNKYENQKSLNFFEFNRVVDDTSTLIIDKGTYLNDSFFQKCYLNVSSINAHNSVCITVNQMVKPSGEPEHQTLVNNIAQMINQSRAVLVICKSVLEIFQVQRNLLKSNFDETNLYTYKGFNEKIHNEIDSLDMFVIECGQVILTTIIGGRGADYKTTPELENNGGLHVILTFLPINELVQKQAFGRTARNGQSGSGQLVLKQIDVMADINVNKIPTSNELLSKRNDRYLDKLIDIKTERFYDQISQLYIQFYTDKKNEATNQTLRYRLQDLHECWTFWMKLDKYKLHKDEDVKTMKADEKFQMFLKYAENIIDGQAHFNPFYAEWSF